MGSGIVRPTPASITNDDEDNEDGLGSDFDGSAFFSSVPLTGPSCPVCQSRCMNPRTLPCKDTVCLKCLADHITKSHTTADDHTKHFECPVCNQKTYPPLSGIPVADWATLFPLELNFGAENANACSDNTQSKNDNPKVRDVLKILASRNQGTRMETQIPLLVIGATSLPNDDIVLLSLLEQDREYRVFLSDGSCKFVSEKTWPRCSRDYDVWGICHVEDRKVAISVPVCKTIQILTVGNDIREERKIKTRLRCFCLANLRANELVTVGFDDIKNKYYRCVININFRPALIASAPENHLYEIDGNSKVLYIALNNKKSRMYLSRELDHSVDCCKIHGEKKFFSYNHPHLKSPRGVAVDNKDILYIVGYGSNNLHLVTPKGIPYIVVTSSKIPVNPDVIVFNQGSTKMYLSAGWPYKTTNFLITPKLR